MSFQIVASLPVYDNRDGICGSFRQAAHPNYFETKALALRMIPCREEDDETAYFVVDTKDAYRRPIYPDLPAVDYSEDIPF